MVCRLCLKDLVDEAPVLLFGFSENHTKIGLLEMITTHIHLKLSHDDPISTIICQECCSHLQNFHEFWEHVQQKQRTLQNEFMDMKCASSEELLDEDLKIVSLEDLKQEEDEFRCATNESALNSEEEEIVENTKDTYFINDDVPLQTLIKVSKAKCPTITKEKLFHIQKAKKRKLSQKYIYVDTPGEEQFEDINATTTTSKANRREVGKLNNQTIANFMKLICELCKYTTDNFRDLRTHFNLKHQCAAYVKCCDISYYKAARLVEHIHWHENPDIFKCDICEKRLGTKISLQVHKDLVHASNECHICHICNKAFRSKKWLENHMLRHDIVKELICEICVKSFSKLSILRQHIKLVHENIHPHVCDKCGKKFKFKPSFEKHLLEHQGIIEPPVQCDLCGEWLKNKDGLRKHRFKHDQVHVECHICGRKCPSRKALNGHIDYMHKRKKTLQCNYCEKSFKLPQGLEEHVAIHTGALLYNCPHCSKEYRSKANMYVHIKRTHTEEWTKSKEARSNDPNLKSMGVM